MWEISFEIQVADKCHTAQPQALRNLKPCCGIESFAFSSPKFMITQSERRGKGYKTVRQESCRPVARLN